MFPALNHPRRWTALFLGAALALSPLLMALDQEFYVGFGGQYQMSAGSDFTGNFGYIPSASADTDYVFVDAPRVQADSTGFSGRLGFKSLFWALELQFTQSIFEKTRSSIDQLNGRIFSSFYDLNGKYYFYEGFRAGGYFIVGVGYSLLTEERIKYYANNTYGTASYSGVSANIGVGVDYYLTHNFYVYGEYLYRVNTYTVVDDLELNDPAYDPFHHLYFGAAYSFR